MAEQHGSPGGAAGSPAAPSPVASLVWEPATPKRKRGEPAPEGFAAPYQYHVRRQASRCLDKDFDEVEGMFFPDMPTAMAVMSTPQWRAPADDDTIPQTTEQHLAAARRLTEAFKDMSIAKDTADNAYRKRFMSERREYLGDWEIENCAWNILNMAKGIHVNGFAVPIFDRALVDSIGQTQLWTFEERINWICLMLKTSKNVASTLMKHEKMWTTIGAPHKLYQNTLVNTESNANRNRWVKDGRARDQTVVKRRTSSQTPDLPNVERDVSGEPSTSPAKNTNKRAKLSTTPHERPRLPPPSPAPMSVMVTDTNMNPKPQRTWTRHPRNHSYIHSPTYSSPYQSSPIGQPVLPQNLAASNATIKLSHSIGADAPPDPAADGLSIHNFPTSPTTVGQLTFKNLSQHNQSKRALSFVDRPTPRPKLLPALPVRSSRARDLTEALEDAGYENDDDVRGSVRAGPATRRVSVADMLNADDTAAPTANDADTPMSDVEHAPDPNNTTTIELDANTNEDFDVAMTLLGMSGA